MEMIANCLEKTDQKMFFFMDRDKHQKTSNIVVHVDAF